MWGSGTGCHTYIVIIILYLQLMKYIVKLQSKGAAIGDELMSLFEGDLNPVAPKAQKKVPVPEG